MHRSEQSWQDPQAFKPERWRQYQQQKGSTTVSSTTRSSSSISNPSSSSSSSSSSSIHTDSSGATPDKPSSSSSTSASNNGAAGSSHQEAVSSGVGTVTSGAAPTSSAASTASNTGGVRAVNAPVSDVRQAATPGAVPTQSVRPGGGTNPLSGMGPNGAYIPFGAGPRNCIGTGLSCTRALLFEAVVQHAVWHSLVIVIHMGKRLTMSGEQNGAFPAVSGFEVFVHDSLRLR